MRSQKSEVRNQKLEVIDGFIGNMSFPHVGNLSFQKDAEQAGMTDQPNPKCLRNEKGIVLVTVLVLSLISLAIIATLVYLVIQGTKSSGFYKRYATAHDAGEGGVEISAALILNRGNLVIPGIINSPTSCVCGFDADPFDGVYPLPSPDTCLCRKLCIPPYTGVTYNWGIGGAGTCSVHGTSLNLDLSPDLRFSLAGVGTNYQVSAKIIDTTIGVTDLSGENLGCGSGVAYVCGTFEGPPTPYLYRIEVNSQNPTNVIERSRLSVLYAY